MFITTNVKYVLMDTFLTELTAGKYKFAKRKAIIVIIVKNVNQVMLQPLEGAFNNMSIRLD